MEDQKNKEQKNKEQKNKEQKNKEQTPEMCLEAIKQTAHAVNRIKIPIDINDIVNALLHHQKDVSRYIYGKNTRNIKMAYQKALMQRELAKSHRPTSLLGILKIDFIKKGWYISRHTSKILEASKDNITISIKNEIEVEYIEMITYSIKYYKALNEYFMEYGISKITWELMLDNPDFDPTKPWEQFKDIGTEIFEKLEAKPDILDDCSLARH